MSTGDAPTEGDDVDGASAGRCGATTRDGTPCQKWPVGGAGEGRCRFHGGASTGPDEVATEHLKDNDHAVGNNGGAPKGNTNAQIHGGFGDWRKAYNRLDDDDREFVDQLATDMEETAAEHAPHVSADRRERLCLEMATLRLMARQASEDVWCDLDGSGSGRGIAVERTVTTDSGDTFTVQKPNPASRASHALRLRERKIAEDLRLWAGFREE